MYKQEHDVGRQTTLCIYILWPSLNKKKLTYKNCLLFIIHSRHTT